ncbi:MAG: hypothetical protein DMG05_22105 [Acidobacteria bacterium]|nr:MAG: hypothetical protein DMG05_22105 [Acidobacteriota bacterium]
MLIRKRTFLGGALLLVLSFPASLSAQTTFATITGTVTDPTGAVVPGVTVTATNLSTNVPTTVKTNEAGVYTIATLKEGIYRLAAQNTGFKELVVENVTLEARDHRRLDLRLELGEVTQSVEVAGGATLIETETARISDTKNADQINALPVASWRGMWPLLSLTPGVAPSISGGVRFAGGNDNQGHWSIDGTTASDSNATANGPMYNYIESFRELKVDLANNSAEFGTVGQVTVISKSGSNELHGSLFDYYVTPFFRARNPFAQSRDPGIWHFPGFSVGGPVYLPKIYNGKEKAFFFSSYETSRGSSAVDFFTPTVPLAAWREGDFSGLGTPIIDPLTGQPFPGNRIPMDRINPVSTKLQERFYPLPNVGDPSLFSLQNYNEQLTRDWDPSTYFTVRGDHHFSDRDAVFGRFTLTHAPIRFTNGPLPALGSANGKRDTRQVAFSYTHTFSPTLVNEFRYGLAYNNLPYHGSINGKQLVEELGLAGLAPDLPDIGGVFKVDFSGSGLTGITQWVDFTDPGYRQFGHEFQEHLSWFRGRHSLKFGGSVSHYTWGDYSAPFDLFGSSAFTGSYTGHDYADFLLGIPTSVSRSFPPKQLDRRRWQHAIFVADDFKMTPRLTLNLGLRYQYHPAWTEKSGLASMFDIDSGKIVVPDGSLSQVSPLFPSGFADIVEAGQLSLPGQTIVRSDRNNFAPRIGIAYRPWGNDTVFRSGFGIFYDVTPVTVNFGGQPFVFSEPGYDNRTTESPAVVFPRVYPATGPSGTRETPGLPAAINRDIRMPYAMQYNFTIEHSRWDTGFRLSYIGTATRQGNWFYDINAPVPDARPYVEKPRRFPNYPGITYTTNGSGNRYHAFTAQAQRPMSKGIYFQAAWTWSRDIGDLISPWSGNIYRNPYDRRVERGVEADYPTHRFNVNATYLFPFGRDRKFLGRSRRAVDLILGGWESSVIFTAATGPFITPVYFGPDTTGTVYAESPEAPLVAFRPDQTGDPNLTDSQRSVNRWFDVDAFTAPPLGRFGNAARGVIKGPGTNIWHMSLRKTFFFRGENGPRLRLEMMAINAFNHPNYGSVGYGYAGYGAGAATTPVNPGFGGEVIYGTGSANWYDQAGSSRQFRAGVRFEW